jgi:hypothetical protein
MMAPRIAGLVWVVVLALAVLPRPAVAQETVATPQRSTPVSAYGGWVAWSEFDPASGLFSLMGRVGGRTEPVPVARRRVPFDVDLGPDPVGDVSAVYSRCRVEPASGNPRVRQWAAGTPQWSTGRGCDLYKYTFATGRETRIAAANSPNASEFLPTIWKERVAFARVYTTRADRRGKRAYLYRRPVLGGGRSVRLPAPPRADGGRVEPGPNAMDLVGRRLGVAWETYRQGPISEIDLITIGEGRRLIERMGSGDIQTVNLLSPAIRDGRIHYGQARFGDSTDGFLRRYRIRTRAYEQAIASPDRTLLWTAAGSAGLYTLISGGVEAGCSTDTETVAGVVMRGPCHLDRLGSINWRPYTPSRFPLPR